VRFSLASVNNTRLPAKWLDRAYREGSGSMVRIKAKGYDYAKLSNRERGNDRPGSR
jgi:hypothetical protein